MIGRHGSRFRPTLLVALLIWVFVLGILVDRAGWLPGAPGQPPAGLKANLQPLWETWRLVQQDYVDRQALDPQRQTRGAIKGLLASLGDTGHTTYLTPEEFKHLQTSLKGEFEGIGAQITLRDGEPTIMHTFPGTPARQTGLRDGDILVEVNGQKVDQLPLERIVQLIRGPAGTQVHLRVRHRGAEQPVEISVTRARVEVPSVVWAQLPDLPIAHIAIREFGDQAHSQLQKVLAQCREQGIKGLLLDVRGNPGGLLQQAVAVTSEFLSEGIVLLEQDAQGHRQAIPVESGGSARHIPLVVLIDQGTASSAEIFAGAIRDHQRGQLVGERTFGTGTVLRPYQLSDGSVVLLAVQEWLTPQGKQIWHHGIEPDVTVKLPAGVVALTPERDEKLTEAQLEKNPDQQLLKALALLKEQIGAGQNRRR